MCNYFIFREVELTGVLHAQRFWELLASKVVFIAIRMIPRGRTTEISLASQPSIWFFPSVSKHVSSCQPQVRCEGQSRLQVLSLTMLHHARSPFKAFNVPTQSTKPDTNPVCLLQPKISLCHPLFFAEAHRFCFC